MPDATQGVVRSIDSSDLERCGVRALVMNVFHLMQRPGSSTIHALGGLNKMSGWDKPIVTDSGGFQAYSLIRRNPRYGRLTEDGITFKPEGGSRKFNLTPEKSVRLQLSYGADVVICLDDCTHVDDPFETQGESVARTIDWARRSKAEFVHLIEKKDIPLEKRPLLFAVIQGGGSRELRKECAQELLGIGFDGFGYGGWPLDSEGNLVAEMIAYVRELVPLDLPMHALGIGDPRSILECSRIGYGLFDSAMPTRDARHRRLYRFRSDSNEFEGEWFSYLYIGDDKHIKKDDPISPYCDCPCCLNYSLGYLHHLFKIDDSLFLRLATMHNLRFMTQLTERLRKNRDG